MDNALVWLPALFVALAVKLNVPTAVGVPVNVPFVARFNPVGKLPLSTAHVIVGSPVAARIGVYDVPAVPHGMGVVVVMVGGRLPVIFGVPEMLP